MRVKNFLSDVTGASRVTKRREKEFRDASSANDYSDLIADVAHAIHPGPLSCTVTSVKDVSPTAREFTFVPDGGVLPPFQAGQYVSLSFTIGKTRTTRPYSLCSAPFQARSAAPFFAITVRNGKADGFASCYLYSSLKVGMTLSCELPFGHFFYEPLRDSRHLVGIAGGSGITPFLSMALEIANGTLDADLTILYGSVSSHDIILGNELASLHCSRVRWIPVISGEPDFPGEKGFIDRSVIARYAPEDATYFICGPLPMYAFVEKELVALHVSPRRIRKEVFGAPKDISQESDFPAEKRAAVYQLTVVRGIQKDVVPAKASEPLAVALERAGILIHTCCRSGACGACKIQLLSGQVYVPKVGDGRRAAEKANGFLHACSSYPLSDVTVKIPIL
jgi:ferredoxin-NADP reductase